jgi:uncharacterized membrane protein SirB2
MIGRLIKFPLGCIYIYDIFFFSFFDFSKFEIWNMYKVKGLYIYICVCVCVWNFNDAAEQQKRLISRSARPI